MKFDNYGGKKCVFRAVRKDCMVGSDRRVNGREFQIVGEAKEKERLAVHDLRSGTVSKSLSDERRRRLGVYGTSKD